MSAHARAHHRAIWYAYCTVVHLMREGSEFANVADAAGEAARVRVRYREIQFRSQIVRSPRPSLQRR